MQTANFDFLKVDGAKLLKLGGLAECYFRDDPSTCLFKLRQSDVTAAIKAEMAALQRRVCEFNLMLSNPQYGNCPKGAANLRPACSAKAVQ